MSACRDEVFDSQEIDDEENNIPGAGSSNDMNIQVVNDDERGNEAEVDEAEEGGEDDDDLLHVPSRKRKLISPVWNCGAAVKIDGGSKCTLFMANSLSVKPSIQVTLSSTLWISIKIVNQVPS